MPKKIVLNIQGGLGNQLFQFYAALELALRTNSDLRINTTLVQKGVPERKVDIEDFLLPFESMLSWESHSKFLFNFERIYVRLSKSYRLLEFVDRLVFGNFRSHTIGWDPKIEDIKSPARITGYFQTFKHINRLRDEVLFAPLRLKNPSEEYMGFTFEIQKQAPIVIHIRRGDYVRFSDYYGLLSIQYYLDAINFLRELPEFKTSSVWVFTDDSAATEQGLSDLFGSAVRLIDEGRSLSPAETLMLMSQGAAIISANSTFSYWALMQSNAKTTKIVPGTWYKNSSDPLDLIPSDWVRLPSRWV